MQEILDTITPYLSQQAWQWILPFVVLLLFVVFFRLFAKILQHGIKKILKLLGTDISEEVARPLVRSLRLLVLVIGIFLALKAVPFFPDNMYDVVNKISQAIILFFTFQIAYLLVQPLGSLLLKFDWLMSELMSNLLMKVLRVSVVFVGGISILEIFGIQVAPIIAGFGLLGVAVALGAQDLFKNLIGGLLILAEHRFDVGEWIRAEGVFEGIVEDIGFRSTLMRGFDKAPVHVPNHDLASAVLINFSRLPYWRIHWILGVEYRTSTEDLRKICHDIEKMLSEHKHIVAPEKALFAVRVDKFSDSSIDVLVNCFADTNDWGKYLAIKEEVAYEIKDIMARHGVGFAFPSQSLYVESMPQEAGR